jgi:beta-galactosidase GanA
MRMKNIILLAIFIGFSNIVLADNKEKSVEVKNNTIVEVINTSNDVKLKNDTTSINFDEEARKETTRLVDNYVNNLTKKMLSKIENEKNRK